MPSSLTQPARLKPGQRVTMTEAGLSRRTDASRSPTLGVVEGYACGWIVVRGCGAFSDHVGTYCLDSWEAAGSEVRK